MNKERQKQLESTIKMKIDAIIREELDDPRMKLMSIIEVRVSRELDSALIYISHPGDESTRKEVERILQKASGFIESKLRKTMRLRKIPKLLFRLDDSLIHGAKIDKLIESLHEEREKRNEKNNNKEVTEES